jgi:hypothetical protein
MTTTTTPPSPEKPIGKTTRKPGRSRGREVQNRKSAKPIKRILDRDTGEFVGWLYEWNTGTLAPMWTGKVCENVVYV